MIDLLKSLSSNNNDVPEKKKKPKQLGLAFGDSLTEGYTFNKMKRLIFTPYTDRLSELLDMDVVNAGMSGERTSSMVTRLAENLLQFEKDSLDLVLLLGGTNDLAGYGNDIPQQIVHNVAAMANQAIDHGARTIVIMTLPPCRIPYEAENEKLQKQLSATNELIRALVSELVASSKARTRTSIVPRMVLVDLAAHFNDDDMIDGVHFSKEKYDEMGQFIHQTLTSTSTSSSSTSTSTNSTSTNSTNSTSIVQ